ncbi:MAG: polysaccharide biosynthesis protein [Oscillospiraceae bacterium]
MKKQGFIYGSIILVASVILTKIIGAFFKIPLANMLGGSGMGYFSCAYGLFLPIYAISVTGLPTAVAKLTAENAVFGRFANVRKIKRISLAMFAIMGLLASILVLILALPFSTFVAQNPLAFPAVMAIAPSILFGCIMSVYRGYYEGLRNMFPTALSQVAEAVVKLLAGILLCYFTLKFAETNPDDFLHFAEKISGKAGGTIDGLVLPFAAAAAILGVTLSSFAGMIFLVLRHKFFGDGITSSDIAKDKVTDTGKSIVQALIRIVIPVAVGSLVTNLTSLIDLGTIVRSLNFSGAELSKIYNEVNIPPNELSNFIFGSFTGLAVTVFNLVPSFTNMFGKGILPSLTAAWSVHNTARIKKSVEAVIFVTGLIAIPCGIGISVLSKEILTFLYSSRQDEILVSYQSLAVLGIAVILLSLTIPIFSMLQAIGRADLPVKIMLLGVAIKLLGNIFLISIPEINVVGAAISTLVCYLFICIISINILCKLTKVHLNIGNIILKPIYAGIMCGATALLVYNLCENFFGNTVSLVVSVAISGGIYLIFLYLLGIFNKSVLKLLF